MANNYSYKKIIQDTVRIKNGVVSDDGATITYESNGRELNLPVSRIFKFFAGQTINLALTTKDERDLNEEEED